MKIAGRIAKFMTRVLKAKSCQQTFIKNTTRSGKQPQSNKSKPTQPSIVPTQGHTKSNPRNQQEEHIVDLTDDDSSSGFTEVKKDKEH